MGVKLTRIHKEFDTANGRKLVLDDISETFETGTFTTIVGPSGCGKTTLLRIVQGLETPTSGTVDFSLSDKAKVPSSFVFQQASLLPWLTVAGNIEFGMRMSAVRRNVSKERRALRLDEVLDIIGLQEYRDFFPAELSGGMQQRVNLGRALTLKPEILLLDEPFSALDAQTREGLQIELRRIATELKATMLFITHDIREAVFLGDRVIVMSPNPGRIHKSFDVRHNGIRDQAYYQSTELAAKAQEVWTEMDKITDRHATTMG